MDQTGQGLVKRGDDNTSSTSLGFTEQEIRNVFNAELERLADAALTDVAARYCGYCYDCVTTTCAQYPVLKALNAGTMTENATVGVSDLSSKWLGLAPDRVLQG